MKKTAVILAHAFAGWALCGAVMGIGPLILTMDATLILHLILAPIFFFAVSFFYFKKFGYTSPMQTAVIFVFFILAMDLFAVSMVILKNFGMFKSAIGLWVPLALIFVSVLLAGKTALGKGAGAKGMENP